MERHSFRTVSGNSSKTCGNFAFLQNFHTRKFGEMTIFFCFSIVSIDEFEQVNVNWEANIMQRTCLFNFKTFDGINSIKNQKQPFANVFQNRCYQKFRNIHRKTSMLESVFNKVEGLKTCDFIKMRLQHTCFPVNTAKFLRTTFFTEHLRTTASENFPKVVPFL